MAVIDRSFIEIRDPSSAKWVDCRKLPENRVRNRLKDRPEQRDRRPIFAAELSRAKHHC
ncbi:MAG: hypothetical protein ACT6RL_08820 [Neoaquamicrobium sediminum]|uniref:hypothetical protein n=1 Tax=Neoaquamicrobium sediminum TaxID=1849104 RepID=UPI0040351508